MNKTVEVSPIETNCCPMNIDAERVKEFINDRKLFLDEDVDENIICHVRNIIKYNMEDRGIPVEERKPIILYIMSYGGNSDMMWMMVDAMRASKTPVYTVNLGVAASAASLIFITGKKRFMSKNATVLIHEGAATMSGDAVKVMDMSESYKKMLAKMKNYILENTSVPKSMLLKKRSNDWQIDAETCMEYSICDQIIEDLESVL